MFIIDLQNTQHSLCSRCCSMPSSCSNSPNPRAIPRGGPYYHSCFSDEEIEALRGNLPKVTQLVSGTPTIDHISRTDRASTLSLVQIPCSALCSAGGLRGRRRSEQQTAAGQLLRWGSYKKMLKTVQCCKEHLGKGQLGNKLQDGRLSIIELNTAN